MTIPFAVWLDSGVLWGFVAGSALVNGANLLPVGVLDGGRLAQMLGAPMWSGWLVVVPAVALDLWLGVMLAAAALIGHLSWIPSGRSPKSVRTIVGTGWVAAAVTLAAAWSTVPF